MQCTIKSLRNALFCICFVFCSTEFIGNMSFVKGPQVIFGLVIFLLTCVLEYKLFDVHLNTCFLVVVFMWLFWFVPLSETIQTLQSLPFFIGNEHTLYSCLARGPHRQLVVILMAVSKWDASPFSSAQHTLHSSFAV